MEKNMKTFIVCFLMAMAMIIAANFPAVQLRPLDTVPRILFYFGLPAALMLWVIVVFAGRQLGKLTGQYGAGKAEIQKKGSKDQVAA
jgi:hypothetical protein